GYLVEVSTDDGANWSTVANVSAATTSTDHFCGPSGTNCIFRVTASNAVGPSPASHTSETITIPDVNSPPVFTLGSSPSVNADVGPQSTPGFATITSAGPFPGETVTFDVSNDANGLFATQPAIDPSGTLTFTPKLLASTGTATVSVTAKNDGGTAFGGNDTSAMQTFSISINAVNQPPTVGTPSTATRGNTRTSTAAPGALAGAADPEGGAVQVCTTGPTATAHGTVDFSSDGAYTYDPAPGFIGTDTVSFSVCDASNASTSATLTVSVHGPEIWYVDGQAAVNGSGTDRSPFNMLASAQSASGSGDIIYLARSGASGANAGITLKDQTHLVGAGVALVRLPDNPDIAAGTAPTITRAGSTQPVVTLGNATSVSGLTISGAGSASGAPGISGSGVGSSETVDHVDVTGTSGPGIHLAEVGGTVTLSHVNVSGSADDAVSVRNRTTSLTLAVDHSTISGTTQAGNGIVVRGGSSGSHPTVSVAITTTTFTAIDDGADAINVSTVNSSSSVLDLTVAGSSFDNVVSGSPQGDNAIRATNDGAGSVLGLDVQGNTFRNWSGDVISVRGRGNSSHITGVGQPVAVLDDNTIGDPANTAVVGSSAGHGIRVLVDPHVGGSSTFATLEITGNNIGGTALEGITVGARRGVGSSASFLVRAAITDNLVRLGTAPPSGAVSVTTQDSVAACVTFTGNDVAVTGGSTTTALRQVAPSGLTVIGTADFGGQSAAAYLNAHNPNANTAVTGAPVLASPNTSPCGNP
ncbi:MAG: tandem-95 repeat protein, partial [Acidimicrobiales bacterium]|nr:tandem-95 repeat protein [Acidimicrobiales bacterium]